MSCAPILVNPIPCSPTPTAWTATADAKDRVVLNKGATVTVSAHAADVYGSFGAWKSSPET